MRQFSAYRLLELEEDDPLLEEPLLEELLDDELPELKLLLLELPLEKLLELLDGVLVVVVRDVVLGAL